MFFNTVKINRRICHIIAILILLAAVVVYDAVAANTAAKKDVVGSGIGSRVSYISNYGWEVSAKGEQKKNITIPYEFDNVFTEYNALQKKQGFDLEPFKGKTVEQYTYEVTNYPNEPEGIFLHILVYDGKVIGGDVCSLKPNGFMVGIK